MSSSAHSPGATLVLLGITLLCACATGGAGAGAGGGTAAGSVGGREATYLSNRPAPRASCRPAPTPSRLPALSELADSAALAASVAEFAARHRLDPGRDTMYTLYSVAFARDGRAEWVRGIQWWMPEGTAEELGGIVRRHLRPQPGSGSVRLRIRPGPAPEIRVGRSEVCRPHTGASFHLVSSQLNPLSKPLPMTLRVAVSAEGRVLGTQLLRSSGEEEVDRWVRSRLEAYVYAPALVDGIPVPMEYEQTVQVQARR